jgi:hypothetical protein
VLNIWLLVAVELVVLDQELLVMVAAVLVDSEQALDLQ